MGERADGFSVAHPDTDAGYIIASNNLTRLVEQGHGLAAVQREGLIDERAGATRKKVLRRSLLAGPIAHLAEVGKGAASDDHELGKSFVFKPDAHTFSAFRTAAGTMAAAAQTNKEVLIKHGLSESVLAELVELLNQFDAAAALCTNGRITHMGATKQLKAVAKEIARTVRVMDARNRQRFQSDGQLLGSWIAATAVRGTPRGASTPKDTASPPQDSSGSVEAGDIRPAA